MTPDRWESAKRLFHEALERPPAEREPFVRQAAGDAELRDEVLALLAAHTRGNAAFDGVGATPAASHLHAGTRLGPYEIVALVGAGGMGEVYKARDTRLGRTVAVKVLATATAASPDALQRFEREARTISTLNHPHICTLYDVGREEGRSFLVMEFLEGETLAERLQRGPVPPDEARRYTREIVEALAEAHGHGIVHRDLKPANVVITRVGAKLLDFGIAKLYQDGMEATAAATVGALTGHGDIVGTPQYMAPEQLEGKPVEARTDIFAVGALIYEMVSGRKAFEGSSRASVVAAILERDPPPLSRVQPLTPPPLDALVHRCLAKRPADRWQSCAQILAHLDAPLEVGQVTPAPARIRRRAVWAGGATLIVGAIVIAAIIGVPSLRRSAAPSQPVLKRLTSDSGLTADPALSPDGTLLAFASDRSGEGHLDIWVKQVAGGDPVRLTHDPADDREPAFSPDGTKIAFRSDRQGGGIHVMSALGGSERLIAREGRAPRFSPDGNWIAYWAGVHFVGGSNPGAHLGQVYVVPSNGGVPVALQSAGTSSAFNPIWSPDGQRILFQGIPGPNAFAEMPDWWVVPFDGGYRGAPVRTGARDLLRQSQLSSASPSGWLAHGNQIIFSATRGDTTNLWRIALSPQTWHLTGTPTQLTFGAGVESQAAAASAAGGSGAGSATRLVFSILNANVDLWALPIDVSRGTAVGEPRRLTNDANLDAYPAISSDGRTVAFTSRRSGNGDIWIKDLENGAETSLVTMPWYEGRPAIAADGTHLAYEATREPTRHSCYIVTVGASREAAPPRALPDNCWRVWSWSSDGTRLLYLVIDKPNRIDLLNVASGETKTLFRNAKYDLYQAYFSPDDRWVGFLAGLSRLRTRIAVAPYQDDVATDEGSWIFLTDGTTWDDKPRWSADGKRVYYTSNRDGFHCIWAQGLDPITKRPVGSPFAIYHSHAARLSLLNVGIDAIELGIAADKIVFPMGDITGNVWMAEIEGRQ